MAILGAVPANGRCHFCGEWFMQRQYQRHFMHFLQKPDDAGQLPDALHR